MRKQKISILYCDESSIHMITLEDSRLLFFQSEIIDGASSIDCKTWLDRISISLKKLLQDRFNRGWDVACKRSILREDFRVVLGLGLGFVKNLKMPYLDSKHADTWIAHEAELKMPGCTREAFYNYSILQSDRVEVEVVFASISQEIVVFFDREFKKLGIEMRRLELAAALDFKIVQNAFVANKEDFLWIHEANQKVHFIFIQGKTFHNRSIDLSSIRDDFQVRLKHEIIRSIAFYCKNDQTGLPQAIWFVSDRDDLKGVWSEALSAQLGISVKPFPLENFIQNALGETLKHDPAHAREREGVSQDVRQNDKTQTRVHFKHNVNIFIRASLIDGLTIDLLPKAFNQLTLKRTIQRACRPVLIFAIVLFGLWIMHAVAQYVKSKRSCDQVRVYNEEQVSLREALSDLERQISVVEDQIAEIENAWKRKFKWITLFSDLQDCIGMSRNTWLDAVYLQEKKVCPEESDWSDFLRDIPARTEVCLQLEGRMVLEGLSEEALESVGIPNVAAHYIDSLVQEIQRLSYVEKIQERHASDLQNRQILKFNLSIYFKEGNRG